MFVVDATAGHEARSGTRVAEAKRGLCGVAPLRAGMHTWYTYPVFTRSGEHEEPDVGASGVAGPAGAGPDVRLPAAHASSSAGPASTWPLNVGQVYTTLTRLERDGLVAEAGRRRRGPRRLPGHRRRPRRGGGLVHHAGRARPSRRATSWRSSSRWRSPCPASTSARVIQQQRTATMSALQDYTRLKRPAARRARTPATWPGAWCSTRWCSRPRPRSAGSTTARPGCAAPPRERPTTCRRAPTARASQPRTVRPMSARAAARRP